jgi:hypothetical protein
LPLTEHVTVESAQNMMSEYLEMCQKTKAMENMRGNVLYFTAWIYEKALAAVRDGQIIVRIDPEKMLKAMNKEMEEK